VKPGRQAGDAGAAVLQNPPMLRARRLLVVLSGLAALAPVTVASAAPPENAAARLAAAQARWKKLGSKSYTYRVLVSCSGCMVAPATVTVRGGKATTMPATGYGAYKTVARVFTTIKHDLAEQPYAFHATYNKVTGVPIDLSVHQDKLGVDDYYGFGIRGFRRLD
jgi:hypothetical protein